MMVFQGILISDNKAAGYERPDFRVLLPLALIMLVVMNISSYCHIKKIDKPNTELKGYANRIILYGIIGGIVLGGLITFRIVASVAF
ncbi:hypothetical protein [Desulfosporosinus sp. OT]|uniref:hypothetical protein n=1 Tax=Desulfosporosinus sp. OT TaxID=913865 RepID=UPI000223AC69|nr:hypothetical protein [Desulfosporosinus sp. OT]EGW38278.1 hypothetical protein DOT_3868 [Desulfosporosinus sp. OT]